MKHYRFTVEGTWGFPLDMLRYDGCFPRRSEDVTAIAHSMYLDKQDRNKKVSISLLKPVETKANMPTEARWRSFGWNVTLVEYCP